MRSRRHHGRLTFRSRLGRRWRRDNAMANWLDYRPLTISTAPRAQSRSQQWAMAGSLVALGAALISVFAQ